MSFVYIALPAIAGVIGTGIGGLLGTFAKDKGGRAVGGALFLAAGVMLGVVTCEMLPTAVENCVNGVKNHFGAPLAVLCVLGVAGLSFFVDMLFEKNKATSKNTALDSAKSINTAGGQSIERVIQAESLASVQRRLKKAGIVTLLAIAIHNVPEGMAIGASAASGIKTGVLVTIIIGVHNVPEGMAIAAPLVSGGVKPVFAILSSFLAGSTTLVGGIIGTFVGGAGALGAGIALAVSCGVMLFVACFELLPHATKLAGEFLVLPFSFGIAVAILLSVLF